MWAHPPPSLLPQLAQFLRAHSAVEALVCAPHWPGEAWHSELMSMACAYVLQPAGSLLRVSADAPARLETWPVVVFHIRPRHDAMPLL